MTLSNATQQMEYSPADPLPDRHPWQYTATMASTVATKAWAAAQWLLNRALMTDPIGLVVMAVIALGAAFYLAYKQSDMFRNIVSAAVKAVWGVIKGVWNGLRATGPNCL